MENNLVKIKIKEELFKELCQQGHCSPEDLQEVVTDDSFLANDHVYKLLKQTSIKSYKALQDYKFKRLHNIKD